MREGAKYDCESSEDEIVTIFGLLNHFLSQSNDLYQI